MERYLGPPVLLKQEPLAKHNPGTQPSKRPTGPESLFLPKPCLRQYRNSKEQRYQITDAYRKDNASTYSLQNFPGT